MIVLLLHNRYQLPGGEDQVCANEGALLERHGHTVIRYVVHNEAVERMGKLELAMATIWNRNAYSAVRALVRRYRPHVAHVHNTLPLLSPAVYYALRDEGVPVVQTLHNYRLLCPNALFFRQGRVCEDCLGKMPWPALIHRCYRQSSLASAGVCAMLMTHRLLGTWQHTVSRYVALTEFARRKFIQGGLPAGKIEVKPNFVTDMAMQRDGDEGEFFLFVGRLDEAKGVTVLLDAWRQMRMAPPLRIVGDGPLATKVRALCGFCENVSWWGHRPNREVRQWMCRAKALIVPSIVYETFGLTTIEAFCAGLPVIASRHGAVASLLEEKRTGLLFDPGNAQDLIRCVEWLLEHPQQRREMGQAARQEFLAQYTPEANYEALLGIYRRAGALG
ncbi:MAG: glycosyltransferase family 4 protein [Chloroflexi bacterium]|nr:glycosyltransferase family 4 protein [Chloroflexota bacterium]